MALKVSVITPCNRNEDLSRLIHLFKYQDYEDKELIIMSDDASVLYTSRQNNIIHFTGNGTTGYKRNKCIERATGEIIINFDSDDWFAPNFITRSVTHLMRSGADMTGLSSAYFYLPHSQLWLYQYRGGQPYVLGSGMCYHRHVWQRKPYPDIKVGEDLAFQTNAGRIIPHDNIHLFMAMIHGKNTASHKQLSTMKRINPEIAESILGESYYLYH